MTPEMQKELLARLDALAVKLGVGANAIWEVLLRQAKVVEYTDIFWMVILGICMLSCIGYLYWVCKKDEEGDPKYHDGYHDDWPSFAILGMAICIIAILICAYNLSLELFQVTFNPQYYALQQLFNGLK